VLKSDLAASQASRDLVEAVGGWHVLVLCIAHCGPALVPTATGTLLLAVGHAGSGIAALATVAAVESLGRALDVAGQLRCVEVMAFKVFFFFFFFFVCFFLPPLSHPSLRIPIVTPPPPTHTQTQKQTQSSDEREAVWGDVTLILQRMSEPGVVPSSGLAALLGSSDEPGSVVARLETAAAAGRNHPDGLVAANVKFIIASAKMAARAMRAV
jgi:hypothetical protein